MRRGGYKVACRFCLNCCALNPIVAAVNRNPTRNPSHPMKTKFFYALSCRSFHPLIGARSLASACRLVREMHPNASNWEVISRAEFASRSVVSPAYYNPDYLA